MAVEFDGFEVGDPDLTDGDGTFWTSGSASGATLVGNDTAVVDSGTYAAKFAATAINQSAYAYHTISPVNDNYAQMRINIASMTGAGESLLVTLTCRNGTSDRLRIIAQYVTAATYTLQLWINTDGGLEKLLGTTVLDAGTWYTVQTRHLVDATAGGGQYWINGISEGARFDLDTDFVNSQPTRLYVGAITGSGMSAATVYFDNIKYDTSYIDSNHAIKRYAGAAWVKAKVMVYNGAAWESRPVKKWDSGTWIDVDGLGS